MKEISINKYISLGAVHWYLSQVSGTVVIEGDNGILHFIRLFKEQLEDSDLSVTLRAGRKLWNLADEIEKDSTKEIEEGEVEIK